MAINCSPTNMGKPNFSAELPTITLRQLDALKPLFNGNKTQIVIRAIAELYKQEIKTMSSNTVTLKFVAQSGHIWEETVKTDDIDQTVEETVATHGDIERVEKLSDPNDMSGETIWRFE